MTVAKAVFSGVVMEMMEEESKKINEQALHFQVWP